ncbi:hypothetical protein VN97_g5896 [Penicillium thymicola]|uniref:Uncharacterized protein n=1 Tax=Penicillium thymicola TaxID=293382 RepID=A0AAI9TIN3_PENTH|nr:hypothetical protein VN97_g5896 [Penicillium thymicola]
MAARTLDRMRKAQSLLRECHDWFVEKDEIMLAVELCQIEGSLSLFFENRCFANTPCPGLQQENLPRLPPFNGYKRRPRRGTYNGYRRAPPANMDRKEAPTGRAGGGQNPRAQTTASTSKDIVSNPICPGAIPKAPRALSAVTRVSPPKGVLLDFNDDVEFVQLSPSVVANMDTAQEADLETKGKERPPGWVAAVSSDQPAPGVEVRLDGDNKPLHQTIGHVAHAAPADPDTPASSHCSPPAVEGIISNLSRPYLPSSPACDSPEDGLPHTSQTCQPVNGTKESEKRDSKNCEEPPVSITTGGVTEGTLVNLDDDLAIILPAGTDAGTDSTIHPEEKDVLAAGLGSGVEHNHQSEDSEDDEIVFQGNAEKTLRPDFKALFVNSDDDPQTARRPIDLKAIFEKYSEVVICK